MSEATQVIHWPGKDTPACEDHAKKLIALAESMGFPVSWTPCAGLRCTNCENEQAKKSKSQ